MAGHMAPQIDAVLGHPDHFSHQHPLLFFVVRTAPTVRPAPGGILTPVPGSSALEPAVVPAIYCGTAAPN